MARPSPPSKLRDASARPSVGAAGLVVAASGGEDRAEEDKVVEVEKDEVAVVADEEEFVAYAFDMAGPPSPVVVSVASYIS